MNNFSYDLREIQKIEYTILCELDRICRNHNIAYFLDSGTAIGAVRHNGFIPWDDDIDVGMMREDYERFLEIAPGELNSKYFLESYKTEEECPYLFSKIRRNGTMYMEWCHRNLNINHGIYIDIFPFDYVPDDGKRRKKYVRNALWLKYIFTLRTTRDRTISPKKSLKWIIISVVRWILNGVACLTVPRKPLVRCIDSYYKKYLSSPGSHAICFAYNQAILFPVECLLPTKLIRFEDKEFPIPINYDQYLKLQFGDYTILPPEEERVGHIPYKVYYEEGDLL